MPSDNVQIGLDPHVRYAIICIVLGLVGLGVGWLVDQIHKDMKSRRGAMQLLSDLPQRRERDQKPLARGS